MPDTTATRTALDYEANRLEHRDRRTAMTIGRECALAHQGTRRFDDAVRALVERTAQEAAYLAIQRERAHHAEDMAMIRAVREADFGRLLNTSPALVIPKEPET